MLVSALPNIALALVLAYLLLSLLATTLNEFISTALKLRARNLSSAVRMLIDDKEIHRLFYESGLIRSTDLSSVEADHKPHPSYIDGATFAKGLLNALGHSGPSFDPVGLKAKIDQLGGGLLRDSLKSILATSVADFAGIQTGIATWFDSSMERLSGDYVRLMKVISLVVGLALAVALNVDSFRIAYYVKDHPEFGDSLDEVGKAAVAATEKAMADQCTQADNVDKMRCLIKVSNDQRDLLQQLPIGWEGDVIKPGQDPLVWTLMKIFGLLLTGLAVSIGAPFWFDILQKVMAFRGAGTKAGPAKKEGT